MITSYSSQGSGGGTLGQALVESQPGGCVFVWSNGSTSNYLKNLTAGTYTITVTEPVSGCTRTQAFTIN
ncbi:MAG: hypothetical protein IPP29_14900 [Bacteroidetes bacterium]|nr:hypothetical protein [Bacteroidota bacterium]